MKKEHSIDAEDFEILETLKSNPAMWAQVKRLAQLSQDDDPSCRLADDAEDAIDKALRGWAESSSGHAEDERSARSGGKRSKKNG